MSTRFYFPASTAAPVNPTFHANSGTPGGFSISTTAQAVRRKLVSTKGSSAIAAGTQLTVPSNGTAALDRQYVSDPLNSQTISGTLNGCQLMVREYAGTDNVDTVLFNIYVVSNDGSTLRGSLAVRAVDANAEFINNATHRNKTVAPSGYALSSLAVSAGDRLVVEIGYLVATGSGTSPEASGKWGENATDLPVNETQTTDGAPWIEFSHNFAFQSTGNRRFQCGMI